MTVVHKKNEQSSSLQTHFNELLNPKRIVSTVNFSTETENEPHTGTTHVLR